MLSMGVSVHTTARYIKGFARKFAAENLPASCVGVAERLVWVQEDPTPTALSTGRPPHPYFTALGRKLISTF